MMDDYKTSSIQNILRIVLGLFMILAGIGHLTFLRVPFQAQVPDWVPLDKDLVVVLSGIVEITLGAAMVFLSSRKVVAGMALAAFYIAIFPGNISQYITHTSAFGLDTDTKRFIRLFFQPVLIAWALWSTGAWHYLVGKFKNRQSG
jgi:uncharacterized membrane protein